MDTSKKYIKMCEEAKEIQDAYLKYGKSYACIPSLFITKEGYRCEVFYQYRHKGNIWLPRQDQLQEMVIEKKSPLDGIVFEKSVANSRLHCRFSQNTSMNWQKNEYFWQFDSMEQLWLAFVMKEKFNKEWRDDTWKKAS